jgi:dihydropyrimidinase
VQESDRTEAVRFDLLLAGGTVVTGHGMTRADVGIRDETIAAVGPDLPRSSAREVLDVSGKLILPGVIDVHVHPAYEDDLEACSRVAAYGGTTTLLHFISVRVGESLVGRLEESIQDGAARSRLDFGLHGSLFEAARQIAEIPQAMALGVRSFKFFLPYIKQGWSTDDYQLVRAMDLLAEREGLAMVHGENGGAIDYLEDRYLAPGAGAAEYYRTHPDALEEEAIFRALRLAEVVGCPLYVAHVTSARSLPHLRRALEEGQPVFAETCSSYLTLTREIAFERGVLAKIGPPLRSAADRAALWGALREGTLQVVSTDHAPKIKDPRADFRTAPYGAPQAETLLPLTYDGGVNQGRISPVRLVQVLSENPARIFGLHPRKGTIAPGADADLVVFDPARPFTIRAENQHSGAGYTLYEGRNVLGWPECSFQRGRRVLFQGEVVAEPGSGRFLPTAPRPCELLTV